MNEFAQTFFAAMAESPDMKANVMLAAIALLSIPMALVGQFFKWLPDTVLPPASIPAILVGLGYVLGHLVSFLWPMVPRDFAIVVLTAAGGGSKFAHDGGNALRNKMKESMP